MSFYGDMQKIATNLLTQFDQGGIQYVRRVKTTPSGRDPGVITQTLVTLKGAAKGATKKYIDRGQAIAGDIVVTAAVEQFTKVGFVPIVSDGVKVGGVTYNIETVLAVPPAGTVVAYKLIGRKG